MVVLSCEARGNLRIFLIVPEKTTLGASCWHWRQLGRQSLYEEEVGPKKNTPRRPMELTRGVV